MDGWVGGWMGGWVDGWMGGRWVGEWVGGWMHFLDAAFCSLSGLLECSEPGWELGDLSQLSFPLLGLCKLTIN